MSTHRHIPPAAAADDPRTRPQRATCERLREYAGAGQWWNPYNAPSESFGERITIEVGQGHHSPVIVLPDGRIVAHPRAAFRAFMHAAHALWAALEDADVGLIDGYPPYLPSFDEFVTDLERVKL